MALGLADRIIIDVCIVIFNILGIFGNLNIVYAHFKLPNLRTKYGLMFTMLCVDQSFCILFEWVNIIYGALNVPIYRYICYKILSPYVFLHCMQSGLMATISCDLLVSILLPGKHRRFTDLRYVLVLCIPTAAYGATSVFLGFYLLDDAQIPYCNPPLSLNKTANNFWYLGAMVCGGITIVTYCVAFLTIFVRSRHQSMKAAGGNVERKALKSLSVILVVFILTRYIGVVIVNLLNLLKASKDVIEAAQTYNVLCAMACYSQNYYVCFARSSEYRRIFWQQLASLSRVTCGFRLEQFRFASSIVAVTEIASSTTAARPLQNHHNRQR